MRRNIKTWAVALGAAMCGMPVLSAQDTPSEGATPARKSSSVPRARRPRPKPNAAQDGPPPRLPPVGGEIAPPSVAAPAPPPSIVQPAPSVAPGPNQPPPVNTTVPPSIVLPAPTSRPGETYANPGPTNVMDADPPHEYQGMDTYRPALDPYDFPNAYLEVGSVWLNRTTGRNRSLGTAVRPDGTFVSVSATDIERSGDFAPGLKLRYGRSVACNVWIEGVYTGLHNWNEEGGIDAGGGAFLESFTNFPFNGATQRQLNFANAVQTSANYSYNSWLHNVELNGRLAVSAYPRLVLLAGFRGLYGLERFRVNEFANLNAGGTATGQQNYRVSNVMPGFQLGADWDQQIAARWRGLLYGRAALLWQMSRFSLDQRVSTGPFGPLAGSVAINRTSVTGLFEFGAGLTWRLTDRMAIKGGYQVIIIPDLVTAAQQTAPPVTTILQGGDAYRAATSINTFGTGIFHGPFATLEFTWGGRY